MKAILLLGTSSSGAIFAEEALALLDLRPIYLLDEAAYSGEPLSAIKECEHYSTNVFDIRDIQRVIEKNELDKKAIAITTLLDELLPNALEIAEMYNLKGPDASLKKLSKKSFLYKLIPEYSPPSLIFCPESISLNEINNFLEKTNTHPGYLLKPEISSGGVGIHAFNTTPSASEILNLIIKQSDTTPLKQQSWILQPTLAGELISLEGYVQNGDCHFMGYSKRTRFKLTETTNSYPCDKFIPQTTRLKCEEALRTLVERSAYHSGYFHCEFILKEKKVYLIDANMGRVGGGPLIIQLGLAYNTNPAMILAHVFDLGVFTGTRLKNPPSLAGSPKETLGICYCIKNDAKILGLRLPSLNGLFHIQLANKGNPAVAAGKSDSAWVGFLAGETESTLKAINEIIISTSDGEQKPFYTAPNETRSEPC